MRLVRLERQQSRVADDVRAALASLGRGSTVIGGIALIGVGSVTERPIEAVVLLPHGVIIVIGVDLPDPALRLEAPLGAAWKADGWPLVADDDAINPATEALDISQACEQRIAALVPGTAPVGTIVAVGPYVETVDQPAGDLAGPVRVLHPTPTTMLAATVSLATAHRPRSVDQVRALIRGLAPEAPEFSDEVLLGEGFSRFTDDSPPESLWDDGPAVPTQAAPAPAPASAASAAGTAAASAAASSATDPATQGPAAAGSGAADPAAPDSRATGSAGTTGSGAAGSGAADPAAPSSRTTGSAAATSRAADPAMQGSAAADSRAADPATAGSRTTGSAAAASSATDPAMQGSAAADSGAADPAAPSSRTTGSAAATSSATGPAAVGSRAAAETAARAGTDSAAASSSSAAAGFAAAISGSPEPHPAVADSGSTSPAVSAAESAAEETTNQAAAAGSEPGAPPVTQAAEPEPPTTAEEPFAASERTEVLRPSAQEEPAEAPALPLFPGAGPPSETGRTGPQLPEPTPRPPAHQPSPFPAPRPAPREAAAAPASRTVRWLPLGAIGLLVALVVAAVAVATSGDDTADAPTEPPTAATQVPPSSSAAPVESLQFALRAADHDQRCASHAFGDAQASLQQTSCSGVRRASYAAIVDGRGAAVTIGIVEFSDAAQAAGFKAVVDTPGGGGVLDLATETGQWGATPVPRFENAAYASKLEGSSVRVVQAVWAPGSSTPDDPGLARAAKAALDLAAQ